MITFVVRVPTLSPSWRNLSGKLTVEIRPRLLEQARRFCFEADAALKAEMPVGLMLADDPKCASGKIHRVLQGTWIDPVSGQQFSSVIGGAPDALDTFLESFSREQLKLQLLLVDCPDEEEAEPEICFQVLVRA